MLRLRAMADPTVYPPKYQRRRFAASRAHGAGLDLGQADCVGIHTAQRFDKGGVRARKCRPQGRKPSATALLLTPGVPSSLSPFCFVESLPLHPHVRQFCMATINWQSANKTQTEVTDIRCTNCEKRPTASCSPGYPRAAVSV